MKSRTNPRKLVNGLIFLSLISTSHAQTAVVPLLSPTGLAFDAAGRIYIAETGRHVVDRYDPATGVFTVVAGDGTQGFSGDGGIASAAELDSPQGLAVDSTGNVYIADTHNHRVRRVDATSGIITTVAGIGNAGFSGDGGLAMAARLTLPVAVALDGSGNLLIADAGNHRVRRVAAGIISTTAGNGTEGNAGDGGAAVAAELDSPGGLAVDPAGNIYIADTHNHDLRVIWATTGTISTVTGDLGLPKGISVDASGNIFVADAQGHRILKVTGGLASVESGAGIEGFAGDGGPAVVALLDGPKASAVSPTGLVTLADTRNQRVRQIDEAGVIRTLAGVGANAGMLVLSGPTVVEYGTGTMTATLSGATGTINFYDLSAGTPVPLGAVSLSGGVATFNTAALQAGSHRLVAAYGGDAEHPAGESAVATLAVNPAPVVASVGTVTMQYGAAVPGLAGTLTGVLSRDSASVSAVFATTATSLSPTGSYPVTATLVGAAAGNYSVSAIGTVEVGKAGTVTAIASSASTVANGIAVMLSAKTVSSTQGAPTGSVGFLDSGVALGMATLDGSGTASMPVTLGVGTHSVTAVYGGDRSFAASSSSSLTEVVTPLTVATPDFVLNATNNGTQTVVGGTAAIFGFGVTVSNGSLSSPIVLSVSGLPAGATASFNPVTIPPGGAVTSFTLTVQTVKAAAVAPVNLAVFFLGTCALLGLRRRRRLVSVLFGLGLLAGCGDRVTSLAGGGTPPVNYPLTVTGTSTAASGAILQHTAVVTLTVQ